jgi:transcriptional regulator with XRE-family HTH domain
MKKNTSVAKKKLTEHMGGALRTARLEAELTQADVAERVGVATEVYGRMERGLLTPSVPNLRKLCLALRLDANVALGLGTRGAAAWLKEPASTAEEPPRLRRLLRTLRQLGDAQLAALGVMARAFLLHTGGRQPVEETIEDSALTP